MVFLHLISVWTICCGQNWQQPPSTKLAPKSPHLVHQLHGLSGPHQPVLFIPLSVLVAVVSAAIILLSRLTVQQRVYFPKFKQTWDGLSG